MTDIAPPANLCRFCNSSELPNSWRCSVVAISATTDASGTTLSGRHRIQLFGIPEQLGQRPRRPPLSGALPRRSGCLSVRHGTMDAMQFTVEDLLAQLAATSASEREKGDKFERLVRRFLMVDTHRYAPSQPACPHGVAQ